MSRCDGHGIAPGLLLALVVLALFGHTIGGHAHADQLAATPLPAHIPGDGHHELTADSDGVTPVPTQVPAAIADGTPLEVDDVPIPGWPATRGMTRLHPPPPLFLLHRAILI